MCIANRTILKINNIVYYTNMSVQFLNKLYVLFNNIKNDKEEYEYYEEYAVINDFAGFIKKYLLVNEFDMYYLSNSPVDKIFIFEDGKFKECVI